MLSKGKAEAVWTGGYLAKQKWSGKGQKMATLEGRHSLRKASWAELWSMVLERYDRRFDSKCQNSCLSGSFPTRNTAETPDSHQVSPWLLEGLPSWSRSEVGSPGLTCPINDLDSPPLCQGTPGSFPLDSGLMDVILVGGLHTPLSLLNLNDFVAIPQFPALKTNLERAVVILVKMVEVLNQGKGLKSKGEKWLTEQKKTSRPWLSLLRWRSEACDLCSASPCCCLTGCSTENRTKKREICS